MEEFWNSILNNFWGILGVLVSGIGLFVAFLQLRKIANRTAAIDDTYKNTIEDLKNSETLTNISTVLQKVETIKSKFHDNKVTDINHELPIVAKLLVTLQSSLSNRMSDLDFDSEKQLCNDLEVKIITSQDGLDKNFLTDEYIAFSKLELDLTKLQGEIKFNKRQNG